MTRTLPWKRVSTDTTRVRRSRVTNSPRSRWPRPKPVGESSDLDNEAMRETPGEATLRSLVREPSTSPPPDAPEERFMEEGFDHDDKYRMVEDEFLEAAKDFTRHLHAREYARMKKAAKFQNAAAINSISRPVTVRMPDETKRKVASISRAKKQTAALQGLLAKQTPNSESDDDDSDGRGSAWLGTALHGLMQSPGKPSASLTNLGSFNSSTRAAAGFKQSYSLPPAPDSPTFSAQVKSSAGQSAKILSIPQDNVTESSDDDDLDARIVDEPLTLPRKAGHAKTASSVAAVSSSSVPLFVREDPLNASKQIKPSDDIVSSVPSLVLAQDKARSDERRERLRNMKSKQEERARKKLKEENSDEIPIFL